MNRISKFQAYDLIKGTKGRFFTVDFVKSDGTMRKMNCRLGVTKYVNGEGLNFNPSEKSLQIVWDTQIKQYRMINLETVTSLKVNGQTYEVV